MKLKNMLSILLALALLLSLLGAGAPNAARAASGNGALVLQTLNYTENPVDISNPDRGFYRGRWQRGDTPFGTTPEVDHRVPVDAGSPLYHGRQMPPVEGDDIEETQIYNGVNVNPYVGGTGVSALPSISFMGFDLCNFSSNAFLSRQAGLEFDTDPDKGSPQSFAGRTGTTQPLTPYALDYIRGLFQTVREGSGVAFVKFSYDGNGFNYVEGSDEHLIFGPEPTYITANNPSAMCDVPGHTDKNWIEYHIWQLKPILQEYEDVIMCVKTGMLGPWGEQHTSPEARNPVIYKKMLDAYLDAVPASRMLLTHAGGFLAWYNLTYGTSYDFSTINTLPVPTRGSPEARFGFFNDSYAAGYDDGWTDNGSLPEGSRMFSSEWNPDTGTDDDWWDIAEDGYDRYKLTAWINHQNAILQGEGGIGNNVFGTFPGAILEAQQLRTTALNMRHGNYQRWNDFIYTEETVTAPVTFPAGSAEQNAPYSGETKTAFYDPVYEGKTGLEYFRDRMGYRFVLREANASAWVARNGTLRFEGKIQNVGFGNVVNEKKVSVILKSKAESSSYTAATTLDARDWMAAEDGNGRADNTAAWRDLNFSIPMDAFGALPLGDYDIYLKINDPKETSANRRCIQFANYDIWNGSLGANLIGSTAVKGNSFADVREGAWYSGDVEYVHTLGLMTGTSVSPMLFSPEMPLTRGMIATVLYRHSGSPDVGGLDNPFSDVAADSYCAGPVKWAAANGIVMDRNGAFGPDDNVTRQDLAVILTHYADFAGIELTKTREYADFADGGDIADYAGDAVKRCYGAGIIGGKPGNLFGPKGEVTRGETAAMLHRLLAG